MKEHEESEEDDGCEKSLGAAKVQWNSTTRYLSPRSKKSVAPEKKLGEEMKEKLSGKSQIASLKNIKSRANPLCANFVPLLHFGPKSMNYTSIE